MDESIKYICNYGDWEIYQSVRTKIFWGENSLNPPGYRFTESMLSVDGTKRRIDEIEENR